MHLDEEAPLGVVTGGNGLLQVLRRMAVVLTAHGLRLLVEQHLLT